MAARSAGPRVAPGVTADSTQDSRPNGRDGQSIAPADGASNASKRRVSPQLRICADRLPPALRAEFLRLHSRGMSLIAAGRQRRFTAWALYRNALLDRAAELAHARGVPILDVAPDLGLTRRALANVLKLAVRDRLREQERRR